MLNSPRLVQLAEAVADGRYPDWAAAESSAESDAERLLIRRLHAASRIGFARAMLYTSSLTSATLGPRADLACGATWGTLRILEKVGRGHFGDVYRAWDPALDREVALKILRRPHGAPSGDDAQVVGEGRLMARVRHPNVATIYGAQTIDGVTGLWMEFVRGRTLAAELAERGPFAAEELTRIGVELCGALAAVHAAGLVHRDVKAQNVMREDSGRVVLGDFGTGLELERDAADELAGTPVYLAPEVFDHQPATPRSDLYSLGVLLFHLATRDFPVRGRSVAEIRAAHRQPRHGSLRALRPDIPRAVIDAIERATARDPASRFATASSMAGALAEALPSRPRRTSRPTLRATAAAIVVLTAIGAGVVMWRASSTPPSDPVAAGINPEEVWTGDHIVVALPSPDGRLLPLLERGRFVLRDLHTGADRLVTQESGYPTGVAAFTPDGRRLVYGWREGGTDDFLLKIVDVDGRNARLLHRARFDANPAEPRPGPLAIAPDGMRAAVVVITTGGNGRSLGLMNLATGAIEELHRFEWEAPLLGNFSPDGRYLAYSVLTTRGDSQQRELRLTEIRTRQVSTLGVPAGQHFNPRFSPDGTHIVFPSGPPDGRSLAAVRFDGSNARGPVEVVYRDFGPGSGLFPGSALGFTQTGAYYFLRTSTAEDAFSVPVDPATGQVLGAPERVSERFAGRTSGLIWSPDGKRLAYIARHERPTTPRGVIVVVRSLGTGVEREFRVPFNNFAAAGYHRWFPDGRSILLVDAVDGRRVFRQLDVETGAVRPLFETAMGDSSSPYRTWIEPGGRAMYYNASVPDAEKNGPRHRRLRWVRRDLSTGEERTVATLNATSVNPSPDGRHLSVLEKNAGPGSVFSFADGSLGQAWTPKNAAFEGGGMGWAPDSRGMYFALAPRGESEVIVNPEQERLEIWYYSLESGSARRSGLTMPAMNQLFVRGDGARLGFTGRVTTGSLWRIDGLLPPPAGTASDRGR